MSTGANGAAALPYLLDTVAWVDMGERFYPVDVFEGLWAQLVSALAAGTIVTLKGVIGELKRGPKEQWREIVYEASKAHLIDEGAAQVQAVFARVAPMLFVGGL